MRMSPTIGELSKALAKMQGELKHAKKKESNPFYKSKYADLAEVIDVCREPLAKNDLSIMQMPAISDSGAFVLETIIMHSSGEWMSSEYPLKPTKEDPQGYGSAITYARRYSLAAFVQIAQEDDDGNSASMSQSAKTILKKEVKENTFNHVIEALAENDNVKLTEALDGFSQEEKIELWKMFNSQQRAAIKAMQKGDL